jgi:hypothetical protein
VPILSSAAASPLSIPTRYDTGLESRPRSPELHEPFAGIGTAGPRQTSAEGFELRFTVKYLAGFLLTLGQEEWDAPHLRV